VKILHLTDLFAPTIGGTETHVLSLVRERVRRGHEMSVATLVLLDGQPSDEIEDVGFRVHRIAAGFTRLSRSWASVDRSPYHPPFPDPVVAVSLRRIIEREQPDAIHAHNWMIYSYLAFKTRRHPPVLWMQHDYSIACAKKTRRFASDDERCPGASPARCVRCASGQYGAAKSTAITLGLFASNATLLRRVDAVVANSEPVAVRAREATGLRGEVRVVSSFIEDGLAEKAASIPRPSYLPVDDGYLLYVGGLGPHKGTQDLVDAYARLVAPPPLVVLGVPMAGQPQRWPDGTILRTHVPHDEVMAAFAHCAMGIVPSRWEEPFGFVALEANVVARPVVATRVGGLASVVQDGVTGVLVAPRDPPALAAAIQGLLDDPVRAAAMGAAGRTLAASYSVRLAAPRFDALLEELVEARHATR
jgi:glycosyltransferase involved in cell wall biosynthesis